MNTLELVSFRLAGGTEQDFVVSNGAVNDWLRTQTGFLERRTVRKEDGSYLDLVLWASHEDATAAAALMQQHGESFEAMRMIDPESVSMSHAEVVDAARTA